MISIVSTPQSAKVDFTNPNSVTILMDVDGEALVTYGSPHGLVTGNYVYIKSNVENYNGFFRVNNDTIFNNIYNIQRSDFPGWPSPTKVQYVNDATAVVYPLGLIHGWNSVHQPIVYKLSSNLWPVNSLDTARTISNLTNSSGYCNITASGDIKSSGSAAVLEFVKISGSPNSSLNGVYQIISYSSDTSFVVDIPYTAANDTDLTGATIQYYYNNYVAKVKVWGGINSGHRFDTEKPYELLATLSLIPDASGSVLFSVSDILKTQIKIKNNLLLATLPNNLDAFTMFYIEYGEEYDYSTGTVLARTTPTYTNGRTSFEGFAVNSKLPFKNVYSGGLSEYLLRKFLTNFDRPTIFNGHYFDLSFIFDNAYNDGEGQFANTLFTSNITGWSSFDGSNASASKAFAWASDGGNGTAAADATSTAETNTKYLAAPKSNGSTWKPGNYKISVRAKNSSLNQAISCTMALYGMNSSSAQTNISFTLDSGSNVFPRNSAYQTVVISFTLIAEYTHLAFRWTNNGGVTTFRIIINVDSVTVDEYPVFNPFFEKAIKTVSVNSESVSVIENFDSGVYRHEIVAECLAQELEASVIGGNSYIAEPSAFTDISPWSSKSATTFNYTDASSPYASSQSYIELPVNVGDIIQVDVFFTLSGTYNAVATIDLALTDSSNVIISNTESVSTASGSGVSKSITLKSTSSIPDARLQVVTSFQVGTGSVDLNVTIGTNKNIGRSVLRKFTDIISETKTIDIDCSCINNDASGVYLSWLNNLGGFDYWYFTAYSDHIIDITESDESEINLFPAWPNSSGEFADTVGYQTERTSRKQQVVRSQGLTLEQIQSLQFIKTSVLVQIVNSIHDRRTVLVDTNSFTSYREGQSKTNPYTIEFTITYTDDLPSQTV